MTIPFIDWQKECQLEAHRRAIDNLPAKGRYAALAEGLEVLERLEDVLRSAA